MTEVGSVSAKITLDSGEFVKSLKTIEETLKTLDGFNFKNLKNIFKEVDTGAKSTNEGLKKTQEELKKTGEEAEKLKNVFKTFKDLNLSADYSALDKQRKLIQDYRKDIEKLGELTGTSKILKGFDFGTDLDNQQGKLQKIRDELREITTAKENYNSVKWDYSGLAELNNQFKTFNDTSISRKYEEFQEIRKSVKELQSDLLKLNEILGIEGLGYKKDNTRSLREEKQLLNELISKRKEYVNSGLKYNDIKNLDSGLIGLKNNMREYESSTQHSVSATSKLKTALESVLSVGRLLKTMMLWDFGFSMLEHAKQTLTAKNEMESYLRQMGKSTGTINYFNKGLDETANRFRKLNKYMIGESVAAIGMEFDLSAHDMRKAMDVVAMIQNEYVRAGRKESEANLAVKDILQGEFLRLSRETGVGKPELEAAGWSGDVKDINSLMDALRKVGSDRHWDLFAEKANSINDVVTMTQNTLGNFAASLSDSVSPLIVAGFNMINDAATGFINWFTQLNQFNKIGVIGGLTALSGVLVLLSQNIGLVDIKNQGFIRSLMAVGLGLDNATFKTYGFTTALISSITGVEGATIKNNGYLQSITALILGLDQQVVSEVGLKGAIQAKKEGLTAAEIAMNKTRLANTGLTQSLKESIFTWQTLGTVIKLAIGIGVVAWLSSIASKCAEAKEHVDNFNMVVENGDDIVKDAEDSFNRYTNSITKLNEQLSETKEGTGKYFDLQHKLNQAMKNQEMAQYNIDDAKKARDLAKDYNNQLLEMHDSTDFAQKEFMKRFYKYNLGMDTDSASEMASKWVNEVKAGFNVREQGEETYGKVLRGTNEDMVKHVEHLKKAGIEEKDLLNFTKQYSLESQKLATYWQDFVEGDFWALPKIGLSVLRLQWEKLVNNPNGIKFLNSLKEFKDNALIPALTGISDAFGYLFTRLMELVVLVRDNPMGRLLTDSLGVGVLLGLPTVYIGKKLLNFARDVKDSGKTIVEGGKLAKEGIQKIIDYVKQTESVPDADDLPYPKKKDKKTGKNKDKTPKPDLPEYDLPRYTEWNKKTFGKAIVSDFLNTARSGLKAAGMIAIGISLIYETIFLLQYPIGLLADIGNKIDKDKVQKGADVLYTVAPVLLMLGTPIALTVGALSKLLKDIPTKELLGGVGKGVLATAVGIGATLLILTETILLINPALWAIESLGDNYQGTNIEKVQRGTEAIQKTGEAISYMGAFLPAIIIGIGVGIGLLSGAFTGGLGTVITGGVVGGSILGIVVSMEALAITVKMLEAPIRAVESIGNSNIDLDKVKKGSETIKVTGEAINHIQQAVSSLMWITIDETIIQWLSGGSYKKIFDSLANEQGTGFISELSNFVKTLKNYNFESFDADQLSKFKSMSDTASTVSDAILSIIDASNKIKLAIEMGGFSEGSDAYERMKGAMPFGGSANGMNMEENTGQVSFKSIFDNMLSIIDDINNFAGEIANKEIVTVGQDKITAIQSAGQMILQLKEATENVKNALGAAEGTEAMFNISNPVDAMVDSVKSLFGRNDNAGYTSSIGSTLEQLERVVDDLITFESRISEKISGAGGDDSNNVNLTSKITQIQEMINQIKSVIESAKGDYSSAGYNLMGAVFDGMNKALGEGASRVNIQGFTDSIKNKFKEGIDPLSSIMNRELDYVKEALDNRQGELGGSAEGLGRYIAERFRAGLDHRSPGILARTMADEMFYIKESIVSSAGSIYDSVRNLATGIVSNFQVTQQLTPDIAPNVNSDAMLQQYTQDTTSAVNTANATVLSTGQSFQNLELLTGTSFANIGGIINTTFTDIATNTQTNYTDLANITESQLGEMQSSTTKNIHAIRNSWYIMQNALISSAEHIRSSVNNKIGNLESNMASFWSKIQNPAILLGSAGNFNIHTHNSGPSNTQRAGVMKVLRGGSFAGGRVKNMGIARKFRARSNGLSPDILYEYLNCLKKGGNCYAGGWNFDWTDNIMSKVHSWRTHFGPIYDDILSVGSFHNNNWPVYGNSTIAKRYIVDTISRTNYDGYFDHRYDPISAWNRRAFNCYDGALLIMALASKFGFSSYMKHGSWDGIPHVWAHVNGIGDIDATAIQGGYGTFNPRVRGAGPGPVYHNNHNTRNDNQKVEVVFRDCTFNGIEDVEKAMVKVAKNVFVEEVNVNPFTGI